MQIKDMKQSLLLPLLLALLAAPVWAEQYEVKSVLEGDRLLLKNGQKVQFLGIDAGQSKEAREFLRQIVQPGQLVDVVLLDTSDTAEILKAYVYTTLVCDGKGFSSLILHGNHVLHDRPHEKSIFLNGEMVRKGYAALKTDGVDPVFAELFAKLNQQARSDKLGMYASSQPAPAAKAAAAAQKDEKEKVIEAKQEEIDAMIKQYKTERITAAAPVEATAAAVHDIAPAKGSVDWEKKFNDLNRERGALIKERDALLQARENWARQQAEASVATIEQRTNELKKELATAKAEEQQIRELQLKLEKAQVQYDQMVTLKQENKALFDDLKRQHESVAKQLKIKDGEIKEKEAQIKAREDKIAKLSLRSDALEEKLSRLEDERQARAEAFARAEESAKEVARLELSVEQLQGKLAQAQKDLEEKRAMETRLEALEAKLLKMEEEKAAIQARSDDRAAGRGDELKKLQDTIDEMSEKLAAAQQLMKDKEALNAQLTSMQEKYEATAQEAQEHAAALDELTLERSQLAERIAKMEAAQEELEEELAAANEIKAREIVKEAVDRRPEVKADPVPAVKAAAQPAAAATGEPSTKREREGGLDVVREYSAAGVLVEESRYRNGELHGDQKFFYDDGSLFIENSYKNGQLNGMKKIYSKDGEIEALGLYENGVLVKKHNLRVLSAITDGE